ncbi:hypothetical protein CHY_2178 [Carboxydothermus hydrogenoformans Z-2901]|uniref:Uncharacterized protein n=1 Tax=Carboxydothermus hydrogenoformans (strain ATCC BAA-161 / DSM 6008 / Z-2901) TaxID=246194 RepID=Q3AA42_CARHZ|nr:hypothetical protein CHY_2178 [Carboxydothermus hydrogenoformans Z-2901]
MKNQVCDKRNLGTTEDRFLGELAGLKIEKRCFGIKFLNFSSAAATTV